MHVRSVDAAPPQAAWVLHQGLHESAVEQEYDMCAILALSVWQNLAVSAQLLQCSLDPRSSGYLGWPVRIS